MNITVLLTGVVAFIWVLVVLFIVLVFLRASRNQPVRSTVTTALVLILVALVLTSVNAGLVFIPPEERGIVISALQPKGYREQALEPGLRWVIPFAESVVRYRINRQTYTMSIAPSEGAIKGDDSITARTQDGQELLVDASVIFAIDPNKIINIHIYLERYLCRQPDPPPGPRRHPGCHLAVRRPGCRQHQAAGDDR